MSALTRFFLSRDSSLRKDLTVLFLLFGAIYVQFLGRIPLFEPDEGRYAEIPREMLELGDFVTPLLNYVKYFEKPPLLYWLNAISMVVFGENEFAVRFPTALCGVLTVLLVYYAGRRLFGRREGVVASLMLGSCTGFMVQSRLAITDILLTFCLSTSLICFFLAVQGDEKHKNSFYYLFYAFAALAVLSKGLIGILLPGIVIFTYLLLTRSWRLLGEMRLFSGITLFLAISAPWFVLVSLKNPEFAGFFFIHEHFERFLTKVHGRYQPLWFFLPVLFVGMLPWSFFIPSALRSAWRSRNQSAAPFRFFLVIWSLLIFLFFSKSNSKMIPYILPVYPPLALLIGSALVKSLDGESRFFRFSARFAGLFLALIGIAAIGYVYIAPEPIVTLWGGWTIGLIFLLQGILALVAAFRQDTVCLVKGLFCSALVLMLIGPAIVLGQLVEIKSLKSIGLAVRRLATPDTVVVSQYVRQGLSFYSHRRVVIFDGVGELEFGSRQGDNKAWFIDKAQLSALWDSKRPVLSLIRRDYLPEFKVMVRTPPRIVSENRKFVLISNR